MTSDTTQLTASITHPSPPRLALKPDAPAAAYIDGAWWPRSRSLPVELPALVAAMSDQVGRVALVGYHVSAWDSPPSGIEIGGRAVQLAGFSADDPHTVLLIGTDGRRIALLVVPPDSADAVAQDALSAASAPGGEEQGDEADDSAARSLTEVATRLARRYAANDEERTAQIGEWVDQGSDHFAHAPIQIFVPILVEHIVRGRIQSSYGAPST